MLAKESLIVKEQAILSADPSIPATNRSVIYPKSDGEWYVRNSDGTIKQVTNLMDTTLADYTTTDPSAPASGLKLFTRLRTGKRFLSQISPIAKAELQSHFSFKRIHLIEPAWGTTGSTFIGMGSNTVVGTATLRTAASTNYLTQARRVGVVSAATSGASGSIRQNQPQWWRGNAAGLGGFYFVLKFGISQTASGYIFYAGMNPGTAIAATTAPSSLTDIIGIGKDSGDTNFQIMCNDGSGTATKTDTGVAPATDTVYALRIFCLPNDSTVYISFENLASQAVIYDGSLTSNIPANTIFLSYILHISNNATAAAVIAELVSLYVETES